jgi:hypothetical protein
MQGHEQVRLRLRPGVRVIVSATQLLQYDVYGANRPSDNQLLDI